MEILYGLIQFTLFLMGKFNLKVEQIESRTASWNGLCSTFKGPLYLIWHTQLRSVVLEKSVTQGQTHILPEQMS